MAYCEKRVLTKRVERGPEGIMPRVPYSREIFESAAERIMSETKKSQLDWIYRNSDRPGFRADAVERLGAICFAEKRGADANDYAVFRGAFRDPSPMVREKAAASDSPAADRAAAPFW